MIFLGFWSQLGWILASKLDPKKLIENLFQLPFFQVAAKRRPRGAQEVLRASQGRLKSLQQPPKRAQECPRAIKTCPGHAQSASRGSLLWGFPCFSMFFCICLRFPAFFRVFSQRSPVNFSTLSSKLNCVRQQAKASKSKQKQAKGSQSKQEPARV